MSLILSSFISKKFEDILEGELVINKNNVY